MAQRYYVELDIIILLNKKTSIYTPELHALMYAMNFILDDSAKS